MISPEFLQFLLVDVKPEEKVETQEQPRMIKVDTSGPWGHDDVTIPEGFNMSGLPMDNWVTRPSVDKLEYILREKLRYDKKTPELYWDDTRKYIRNITE